MTQKIYKSARGKTIDMGALRLQNEHVRAVGNMSVNARGDRIDAQGKVIDSKSQQTTRRIQRQTNVTEGPVHTSSRDAAAHQPAPAVVKAPVAPVVENIPVESVTAELTNPKETGGLAGAIARSKKQKETK